MSMNERTERLLGKEAAALLGTKKAVLAGIGGVGGGCAEALARSGVGALHLIDFDTVSESNLNRQLFALKSTLGMKKTEAALRRLRDVSDAAVTVSDARITEENVTKLVPADADVLIDAIDDVKAKIALAVYAREHGIPEICCLGAGNRLDPASFYVTDLFKTEGDPLARRMRSELRKLGFTRLPVVFSKELPVHHETPGPIGSYAPAVTAAGMCAAAGALNILLKNKEENA